MLTGGINHPMSNTTKTISQIKPYAQKQSSYKAYITRSEKSSLNALISINWGVSKPDVRKICEPKRKNLNVAEKLHMEELLHLYSSSDITVVIKSIKMGWTQHILLI